MGARMVRPHTPVRTGGPRDIFLERLVGNMRLGAGMASVQDDLQALGITVEQIDRNLSPSQLYEHAIRRDPRTRIVNSGALAAYSGAKTGRSPLDKRLVKEMPSEADVWWGKVNVPLDPQSYKINRERAID